MRCQAFVRVPLKIGKILVKNVFNAPFKHISVYVNKCDGHYDSLI